MANLTLELSINSASNLTNVNLFTKMDVFVAVNVKGDRLRERQKVKTAVDRSGGSNPTWNHAVTFPVNERLAHDGCLTLAMRVVCRRVLGDKRIGAVNVPLLELLNSIMPPVNGDGNDQGMKFVTYVVKTRSGKRRGSLTFSYRFKPDLRGIVNRHSFPPANSRSRDHPPPPRSVSLPSQIDHQPPSPPPPAVENPQAEMSQPPNLDHQKLPVAAGSTNDPLPVSYGAARTSPPYSSPTSSQKSGYAYHHAPPPPPSPPSPPPPSPPPPWPQSLRKSFPPPPPWPQSNTAHLPQPPPSPPYRYAPPSPGEGVGLGIGLGVGLLGGLMMGDLVSDVVNCFDL